MNRSRFTEQFEKEVREVNRKYWYELTMFRIFGPGWWERFPVLLKIRKLPVRLKVWRMKTAAKINGLGDVSETDSAFLIAAVMITLMLWFAFLLR